MLHRLEYTCLLVGQKSEKNRIRIKAFVQIEVTWLTAAMAWCFGCNEASCWPTAYQPQWQLGNFFQWTSVRTGTRPCIAPGYPWEAEVRSSRFMAAACQQLFLFKVFKFGHDRSGTPCSWMLASQMVSVRWVWVISHLLLLPSLTYLRTPSCPSCCWPRWQYLYLNSVH